MRNTVVLAEGRAGWCSRRRQQVRPRARPSPRAGRLARRGDRRGDAVAAGAASSARGRAPEPCSYGRRRGTPGGGAGAAHGRRPAGALRRGGAARARPEAACPSSRDASRARGRRRVRRCGARPWTRRSATGPHSLLQAQGAARARRALRCVVTYAPGRTREVLDLALAVYAHPALVLPTIACRAKPTPSAGSCPGRTSAARGRLRRRAGRHRRHRPASGQRHARHAEFLLARDDVPAAEACWTAFFGPRDSGVVHDGGFEGS